MAHPWRVGSRPDSGRSSPTPVGAAPQAPVDWGGLHPAQRTCQPHASLRASSREDRRANARRYGGRGVGSVSCRHVGASRTLTRSGARSSAQAFQLASQALARSALASDERHPWPGLRHDRRAVVDVAGRCDGGPDTRLDRPDDLDDALSIGNQRVDPITRSHLCRRLCRRSVHEDVAAVAQPGRERAGLHEAHRAQPAIDARLVGGERISHAS